MLKHFRDLSFTQQLTFPIALMGFVILGGVTIFTAQNSFKEAKRAATASSLETGKRSSQQIKAQIDHAFSQGEVVGRYMAMEKAHGIQDRSRSYNLLKEILKGDSNYLATWSAWEPNAFDGRDAHYANGEWHEKTGRVYPWWVRQGSDIVYKTLLNEETPDLGDWYFEPMKTKQSLLVDPYKDTVNGKELVMTSAVYTIVINGKPEGLIGIDISLDRIKEMTAEVRPFENSQAYLISDKMVIVAGAQPEKVMQPFEYAQDISGVVTKKDAASFELKTDRGIEQFLVVPVPIYDMAQTWYLVIKTPEATILAEAYQNIWKQSLLSLGGLILLMTTVYFGAKRSESKLSQVARGLTESSSAISTDIGHLNTAGAHLAEASTKAAASVEESVASLEEITSMVRSNTGNAEAAASLSAESVQLARTGEEKIKGLVVTMGGIEKSSQKIEEIINIIDDISFQTNLLALNASVEAARAGEHGRGFAVVADAVRSLAQRSALAAKDINVLISESVAQVKLGTQMVQENGTVLKQISDSIDKVATLNGEIASASQQQTSGIEQIHKAIGQLDQVIQSNAAEAQEIVSTASDISSKSEVMTETVRVLKAS